GLDLADDMDGDGLPEIVFSRGSTRGGHTAPALFIMEGAMNPVGIGGGDAIPQEFNLLQNYPNPFNPETNITFALPRATQVTLTIYNVLGQKVRTLVNGFLEARVHTVRWDGKDDRGVAVPSGFYIYRLEAGDFTGAKRMLLIR
ncbi:MAG: T9SS C-terminal target domain-containing protein, partial [Calditrichaeota bacterium]